MSGIIKQQILKRLSKFTKNLSADRISLSAMKGEGDLTNLELDEIVLMELLGAPPWMKLNRASCNKLTIKIQWTKLSSQPIILILDEVNIDMETCDHRASSSSSSENSLPSYSPGKYGYTEQIMDGISLSINVININFRSISFHATFQMSRVTVESRTPLWQPGSLDKTRVKNDLRGEIIIFKEIQWQAVRIEANALANWILTTPLRLIANQSKIRITLKKRITDCSVVCTRVEVNMDDVLWVLTDSQVFAAITFIDDLKNIVVNNSEVPQKVSLAKPVQHVVASKSPSATHKPLNQHQLNLERFFDKFNESSYHFLTGRVELHLCDDASQECSSHRCRVEGGAMQLVLGQLEFSYYPYRKAGASRKGWPRYNDCNANVEIWVNKLLSGHLKNIRNLSAHQVYSKDDKQTTECCVVLRLKDICLYRVSSSTDNKRSKPQKFLSSDKKRLLLPEDMPTFHVEYTYYFSTLIPPCLHITINPICLSVHYLSLLWINTFALNVAKKAEKLPKKKLNSSHVNIRSEFLMPRMTVPASEAQDNDGEDDLLQIQTSKLLVTNLLSDDGASKSSTRFLAPHFNVYKTSKFHNFGFSCKNESGLSNEPSVEFHNVTMDPFHLPYGFLDTITKSCSSLIKQEGEGEMWCISCDQFWVDFLTPNKQQNHHTSRRFKTQNFLESFSFTAWMWASSVDRVCKDEKQPMKLQQSTTCLISLDVKIKIMVDCNQLNFLMRLIDSVMRTQEETASDAYSIGLSPPEVEMLVTLLLLLPKVEICLILPLTPLASSSSSSSLPYVSSSSSSSLSSSNRPTELCGVKPLKEQIDRNSETVHIEGNSGYQPIKMKSISKDDSTIDVLYSDSKRIKSHMQNVGSHLNHFLDLPSLNRQTKETMSSMLTGISTRLRGSDSHIHDDPDDEELIEMMLSNGPEIPAFAKPSRSLDDDFDDVISDSSSNKKKVISVLTVAFQSLEMLIQMNLERLKLMMMIDNVLTDEIEKINYEKFKTTYLLGCDENLSLYNEDNHFHNEANFLKLYYDTTRAFEEARGHLHLEIKGWTMKLKSSTVIQIMQAFEGHVDRAADVMTLHVLLENIRIDILDKSSNHQMSIDNLKISKGLDGLVHIGNGQSDSDEGELDRCQLDTLNSLHRNKVEHKNTSLKKQLKKLGKLTVYENHEDARNWKETCQKLEGEMHNMEDRVFQLTAERDSLLKLVDTLQTDLEFSEKMRTRHT